MTDKKIFLTFDDGPHEPYTSQILDVLHEFNAKATFFVIGKNIDRHPDSIKRIVNDGHAIGIHSYSHSLVKVLLGSFWSEIPQTKALIKKYTGVQTNLYRSPWGVTMPWLGRKLKNNGYKVCHWSIMAHDWWQPSAGFIAGHIIKRSFSGATILLHDGDQVYFGSRKNTIEALRSILKELTTCGYKFETLESTENRPVVVANLVKDNLAYIRSVRPVTATLTAMIVLAGLLFNLGPRGLVTHAQAMERKGSHSLTRRVHQTYNRTRHWTEQHLDPDGNPSK